jgi:hypothetical protein
MQSQFRRARSVALSLPTQTLLSLSLSLSPFCHFRSLTASPSCVLSCSHQQATFEHECLCTLSSTLSTLQITTKHTFRWPFPSVRKSARFHSPQTDRDRCSSSAQRIFSLRSPTHLHSSSKPQNDRTKGRGHSIHLAFVRLRLFRRRFDCLS